jgi:hypothetical protein
MGKGKDGLVHEIGQALTKGGGPNGYLAVSIARLGVRWSVEVQH